MYALLTGLCPFYEDMGDTDLTQVCEDPDRNSSFARFRSDFLKLIFALTGTDNGRRDSFH
jgi:hypothetical protein